MIFWNTKAIVTSKANMAIARRSGAMPPVSVVTWSRVLSAMVTAVAKISATTQGRTPPKNACTPLYLRKLRITDAMSRMMINEGSTTLSVAVSAPNTPPCVEPTKVAILTAIGPGVDSATAIILSNCSSVSQPSASALSRMSEIMAYPPPKVKSPISKKVTNSCR